MTSTQSRVEFPPELYDFARGLSGDYAERFDAILDRAFAAHEGLLLTGHGLRTLAGGGTNPVAQAALDRFRRRLHRSIGPRVAFNSDVPDDLAKRFGVALGELWADARSQASQEFKDAKDALVLDAAKASSLAEEQSAARQAAESQLSQANSALALARFDLTHSQEALAHTKAQLDASMRKEQEAILQSQEVANRLAQADLAVDRLRNELSHVNAAAQQEMAKLIDAHRIEREEVRHKHLLALDGLRQEAKQAAQEAKQEARAREEKHAEQVRALEAGVKRDRETSASQIQGMNAKVASLESALAAANSTIAQAALAHEAERAAGEKALQAAQETIAAQIAAQTLARNDLLAAHAALVDGLKAQIAALEKGRA